MNTRSPYDIPPEAETFVRTALGQAARTAMEAMWFSVLPAVGLVMTGSALSYVQHESWVMQSEHWAVTLLAAFAVGCARLYLDWDNPQQEIVK